MFSFWTSPFDRPAGVIVNGACAENDHHWSRVNYSDPDQIVHMFHSGLWGRWAFAVDSVTFGPTIPPPSLPLKENVAALPAVGLVLWLDASAITGVPDGAILASWADKSGSRHDATQGAAAKQPTYTASGWQGGLPSVRFRGGQVLEGSVPSLLRRV